MDVTEGGGAGPVGEGAAAAPAALALLHRDESLVAVDKPPGTVVHRSRDTRGVKHPVLQRLRDQLGCKVYPVHRLDRAASGVLLFALSAADAQQLQQVWRGEETRKLYLVCVRGSTPEAFASRRPLTGPRGIKREARTEFRKLAEFSGLSLLEARIRTGRRHQIRRHLNHLAHQVLGDTTYGKGRLNRFFRDRYGLPRMFLHAWEVRLPHPRTGEAVTIRAPLAADLRAFLLGLPDVDRELVARL